MSETFTAQRKAPASRVNSILAADCGSSFTRLFFIDRVEAGYAFVAQTIVPTTVAPPWSDLSIGVMQAIEEIEVITGRRFLDENGSLIAPERADQGVDLFVSTSSAGEPLRVILAGLMRQESVASLEQAALGSYVQVQAVIARDESGQRQSDEEKIDLIRQNHPDVVWVTGGTEGGAAGPIQYLFETLALACSLVDSPPQPRIVYAGNSELRSEIVKLAGEELKLEVIDNVQPALDMRNLAPARAKFESLYAEQKMYHLPGIGSLVGWSSLPVLPTAQALGYLTSYLDHRYAKLGSKSDDGGEETETDNFRRADGIGGKKGVLCVDVGSASTTVAASFGGRLSIAIAADLGVGHNAPTLLEKIGVDVLARWLPFEPEPGELETVLLNKGTLPATVPVDERELLIEQAAAREALRATLKRAQAIWQPGSARPYSNLSPWLEPIIATGSVLAKAPKAGQVALMLLDAIEPIGITTLVADLHGLAPVLGAVAVTQPIAAVQTLDEGAFLNLGTVVVPIGRARPGDVVLRIRIAFEAGGELELEVKYGSLEVLPLRPGEKAVLDIKPRRGFSVGPINGSVEVNGGIVGLVIDARGRPLRLPSDPRVCREYTQQWMWDIGT